LVPEGEVNVGTTIAVIGAEGETVEIPESANGDSAKAPAEQLAPSEAAKPQPEAVTTPPVADRADARVKASPLARRMARQRGTDLRRGRGTGGEGRMVAEDVERAAAGAPAPAGAAPQPAGEVQVVQLTSTRKTIARRLTEAWQAPVFQLGVSADMTEVLALRE